jgi:hypothetical protein
MATLRILENAKIYVHNISYSSKNSTKLLNYNINGAEDESILLFNRPLHKAFIQINSIKEELSKFILSSYIWFKSISHTPTTHKLVINLLNDENMIKILDHIYHNKLKHPQFFSLIDNDIKNIFKSYNFDEHIDINKYFKTCNYSLKCLYNLIHNLHDNVDLLSKLEFMKDINKYKIVYKNIYRSKRKMDIFTKYTNTFIDNLIINFSITNTFTVVNNIMDEHNAVLFYRVLINIIKDIYIQIYVNEKNDLQTINKLKNKSTSSLDILCGDSKYVPSNILKIIIKDLYKTNHKKLNNSIYESNINNIITAKKYLLLMISSLISFTSHLNHIHNFSEEIENLNILFEDCPTNIKANFKI